MVRNITDVDQDILDAAARRGVTPEMLVAGQVEQFEADMDSLFIQPVISPRASEHIQTMVAWIGKLLAADLAYEADGFIYFDTTAYGRFGSLSGLPEARMIEGLREAGEPDKAPGRRSDLDFILWRPAENGNPAWPGPLAPGRPGWHIECSAMAISELGHPVTIHGGGADLLFPHHECELAQAIAGGADPFVSHWVHVSLVEHEGQKMSKSLGNLVFVRDLLEQYPAASVRLYLAGHHYRQPFEFGEPDMQFADGRRRSYLSAIQSGAIFSRSEAKAVEDEFVSHLDNDLDTPGALAVLDGIAVAALHMATVGAAVPAAEGRTASSVITKALSCLGIPSERLAG